MSTEQSLVGAMGWASWRVRQRLREYVSVAPEGRSIHGGEVNPPTIQYVAADGLNEVGVTDEAMVTLWRFGPHAVAFAVSSGAEHHHLGADIAIIHSPTGRVLLYQAKLARSLDGGKTFKLKSELTASQAQLLNQQTVSLQGEPYVVTGRLALYQCDVTPFLDRCGDFWAMDPDWSPWRWTEPNHERDSTGGREYYEHVLRGRSCSPSGVVAARLKSIDWIGNVKAAATWPWEFDIHEWLNERSPLDPQSGSPAGAANLADRVPDFEDYEPAGGEPEEASFAMARELAEQLGIEASTQLYVLHI